VPGRLILKNWNLCVCVCVCVCVCEQTLLQSPWGEGMLCKSV
jgi:hypothetical protein